MLHAIAGIGHSSANAFPLLLLGGSSETHLVGKGAFQELDSISLLTSQTKISVRPPDIQSTPQIIANAYRSSWYGRPGTGFVDLPADLITDTAESPYGIEQGGVIHPPSASSADEARLFQNFSACQDCEGASSSYWEGRCVCKSRRCNPRAY